MFRWFEHKQVYAPDSLFAAEAGSLGRPFEDVTLHTVDGIRLHGWFFPADPGSPRAHLVFLLLHGNSGNISGWLNFYDAWLRLGLNVFTFDYRGYGRSDGRPSEEGTYLDAQAAHRWLRAKGFAPGQIVAVGNSLGGGVASELALREPLGALILHNTFTSIPDIGADLFPYLPVRRVARIHYDTHSKLPRISVPVLVAHSPGDRLIGFHHGERNFAAAREPKMFLRLEGDHSATLEGTGRALYIAGIERFLDQYLRGP